MIGAEVEIAKRNELHRFAVLPKRWVVERSFSWLEKGGVLKSMLTGMSVNRN